MSDARRRTRWDVILAEDDDDHALLIEMALEKASRVPVDLRRARNGDEAIDLITSSPPDLLLLDLKMPERSGHEVLEKIKGDQRLRRIPVAVLGEIDLGAIRAVLARVEGAAVPAQTPDYAGGTW